MRLIQDGPDERRRFMNISISQLSKSYYTALLRYNKILEQRNNLLKDKDIGLVYQLAAQLIHGQHVVLHPSNKGMRLRQAQICGMFVLRQGDCRTL